MTMTTERTTTYEAAATHRADGPISAEQAALRLGGDLACLALWEAMEPLLDSGERAQEYWQYVPPTPLVEVPTFALPPDLQNTGHRLLIQDDGAMPTGAYKIHGVFNKLLLAQAGSSKPKEVVGASTGNHAAALALGSTALGLRSTLYMPAKAAAPKVASTEQFGGMAVFRPSLPAALAAARKYAATTGALFIHPYDDLDIIAGQGMTTAGLSAQLEINGIDPSTAFDQYEPAGGGGVATGNGVSGKVLLPQRWLHVVQSAGASAAVARLRGKAFHASSFDGSVDGAAVMEPGKLGMRLLQAPGLVDGTRIVSYGQVGEAMEVSARVPGLSDLAEPAGALALAGALADMRNDPAGNRTKIAHLTGINTMPAKVLEFARHAYALWEQTDGREGLSGERASWLVSQANIDRRRRPTALEEQTYAQVADARRPRPVRHGLRVASGR